MAVITITSTRSAPATPARRTRSIACSTSTTTGTTQTATEPFSGTRSTSTPASTLSTTSILTIPRPAYSPGRLDYGMKPPKTDELIGGVQYELLPGFAVSANYTYRHSTDFVWNQFEKTRGAGDLLHQRRLRPGRHRTGMLPDGTAYSVPYYTHQERDARARSTMSITNRKDYSQTYQDLELSAVKRMSNNWMMRANVTLSDWTQHVGPGAVIDPHRCSATAQLLRRMLHLRWRPVASAAGSARLHQLPMGLQPDRHLSVPWQINSALH